MDYRNCKFCGRQTMLATTAATGARMPIDPVPSEAGNVLVDGFGRAHVFRNATVAAATREEHAGQELGHADQHTAHVATCPARAVAEDMSPQDPLL